MSRIHKFTMGFSPLEDRIVWITEDIAGAVTRLWFTRRLSGRLVAALTPLLTSETLRAVPPEHREVAQSFEQAAAIASAQRVEPVQPRPDSVSGLVARITAKPTSDGMVLVLHFGHDEVRKLALTSNEIRQMLAALWGLYGQADWSREEFPGWVGESPVAPDAPAPKPQVN